MRALGIDPVSDTRETFRALVTAMSRPGTVQPTSVEPADHAVVATLVDHEMTARIDDETLRSALSRAGRLNPAPHEKAAVVHVDGSTEGRIREVRRGTLKEPSEGATAVYHVDGLWPDNSAPSADETTRLCLRGPGVLGERTLAVGGLPADEAEAISEAMSPFPRGIDAVLATESRIAALPRSVNLEVA